MNMSYIPGEGSFGKDFLKKKKIPQEYKEFLKEYVEISRKELLLVHLERQLKQILDSDSKYNYQVFVITFANEIVMYGNGCKQNFSMTLNPNNFDNLSECMKFGKSNGLKVFDKNKDSNLPYLFETLHTKEADGATSLGPAIACGLGVIEAIKPDLSQFYIFTDGVANIGIGDMETGSEEAKKTYSKLADLGLENGVVFHVFGFQDENSKLSILQELTDRASESKLERIKTPLLKEEKKNKVYTYDEKDFEANMKEALRVSANTYGILSKLKVFSNATVKFCKDSDLNVKEKKAGKTMFSKKLIGNISKELNNVSMKYQITNEKGPVYFQFQLRFTRPDNGEKKFIVINLSSEIKKEVLYKDVNLKESNLILINDSFEKNKDLFGPYLNFIYECKHRSQNPTFEDAEEALKDYIFKCYPGKKKENKQLFENAENKVLEKLEDEKNKMKEKEKEGALKKPVENLKKESEKVNVVNDDDSDDDEKTITRRRIKKKVNNKAFDDEEAEITIMKKVIYKKEENKNEDEEEKTLAKKIYGKKI